MHIVRSTSPIRVPFRQLALLALLSAACALMPASAQNCLSFESQWPWGPSLSLARDGGRLYQGAGAGLVVQDIGVPSAPMESGRVAIGDPVWSIAAAGNLVVVTDRWDSVRIVNVANPAAPVVVGHYQTNANSMKPYSVAISGQYAFVAMRDFGIQVLDLSNPANPTLAGSMSIAGVGFVFDVKIVGNRLYLAADTLGLRIIDISNPTTPQPLGAFTASNDAISVLVEGNTAYLAGGGQGIFLVDVSNPAAPTQISQLNGGWFARRLYRKGASLFLADGVEGLQVIDITNPTIPVTIATRNGPVADVAGSGATIYVAQPGEKSSLGARVRVFDVTTASNLIEGPAIRTDHYAYSVALDGDLGLVADGKGGVVVLDLDAAGGAVELSRVATAELTRFIVARDGFAYVSAGNRLLVIDYSVPSNAQQVANFSLTGSVVEGLAIANNRLYVANFDGGLRVFDLGNPAQPVEIGSFSSAGGVIMRVAAAGNLAVVAGGTQAATLDISGPSPVLIKTFTLSGVASGLELAGSTLLVAAEAAGLLVWDVSTASMPMYRSTFQPFPLAANSVRARGNRAWIGADTYFGVMEVDISNPLSVQQVATYNTSGSGRGIAVDMQRVLVADWDAGVVSLRCANSVVFSNGFE